MGKDQMNYFEAGKLYRRKEDKMAGHTSLSSVDYDHDYNGYIKYREPFLLLEIINTKQNHTENVRIKALTSEGVVGYCWVHVSFWEIYDGT